MKTGLPALASIDWRDGVAIVYDGECPFCARYVLMTRLRDAAGPVELIDARTRPDIVAELRARNLDINSGMAVQYAGTMHFGADAMTLLSLLSSRVGMLNSIFAGIFRNRRLTAVLYPVLRTGRNMTLRLLGRTRIT